MRVDVGDFAIVRVALVPFTKRLRRHVNGVRVEVMDPEEEGLFGVFSDELRCRPVGQFGRPLAEHVGRILHAFGKVIVIEVESLVQAESGVENKRRDHGAGLITFSFKTFRQRSHLVLQPKGAVGPSPVVGRIEPRKERTVGRQSCG